MWLPPILIIGCLVIVVEVEELLIIPPILVELPPILIIGNPILFMDIIGIVPDLIILVDVVVFMTGGIMWDLIVEDLVVIVSIIWWVTYPQPFPLQWAKKTLIPDIER